MCRRWRSFLPQPLLKVNKLCFPHLLESPGKTLPGVCDIKFPTQDTAFHFFFFLKWVICFYKISKPGHIFWDTKLDEDLFFSLSSLFPNNLSFLTLILFLTKCLAKIAFSGARLSFGTLVQPSESDWDRHCMGPQLWPEVLSLIFEVSITLFSLFWPVNKFKCFWMGLYVKTGQCLAKKIQDEKPSCTVLVEWALRSWV